jgi:hypothetical protein
MFLSKVSRHRSMESVVATYLCVESRGLRIWGIY